MEKGERKRFPEKGSKFHPAHDEAPRKRLEKGLENLRREATKAEKRNFTGCIPHGGLAGNLQRRG